MAFIQTGIKFPSSANYMYAFFGYRIPLVKSLYENDPDIVLPGYNESTEEY
jgi:hypothetical protein